MYGSLLFFIKLKLFNKFNNIKSICNSLYNINKINDFLAIL